MAEIPPGVWAMLGDPDVRKVFSYLAKALVASPLGLSYDLKMDENKISDVLKKLEETGLVKREVDIAQSKLGRPRYTLTDQGLKLRTGLLKELA